MKYFPNIEKVLFEGGSSANPFAFKYYNADELLGGKTMKQHLRFAMCYWHTMLGKGSDAFGVDTAIRPWDQANNSLEQAMKKVDAVFELMNILGIEYYCFHDEDIAPYGNNLTEFRENLDKVVEYLENKMQESNIKLLWGTSNNFADPCFLHGAATSCNASVFAYAAAKVKKMMEITHRLKGENFVFWGGREGYDTLLNTNVELELDNLARFLQMAVNYKKEIGFTGQFLIEPKPQEPTKHQYDFDAQTTMSFLRKYNLDQDFKLNIEANHATLAGHTFEHELHMCRINQMLGSIDANRGDDNCGWDTDQFPSNIYDATLAMIEVLKNEGLGSGGLNFDAKVRRASFEENDLILAFITGMDTFAQGLKIAYKIIQDGKFDAFIQNKYNSFEEGIGQQIVSHQVGFKELENYALLNKLSPNISGRQEQLEALLTQYILETK